MHIVFIEYHPFYASLKEVNAQTQYHIPTYIHTYIYQLIYLVKGWSSCTLGESILNHRFTAKIGSEFCNALALPHFASRTSILLIRARPYCAFGFHQN